DGRVAAAVRDSGTGDAGRRVRGAVKRHAVAALEGRNRVVSAARRAVVPEGLVAAREADQCRAAREPLNCILRTAPHRRVAAAGAGLAAGGAAADRVARNAADRLVAAAAAADRTADAAKDRLVAAAAAPD